ncbi:MAG: carbon-nitrogen hydrolase family protein [Clostridia bacterium]|nr:carbon-nitrogen hydrolase family protein [Clostridia bacterium]
MKIATIAINERGFIGRTQSEMLAWCTEKCRELKSQSPDMIIFPEIVFIMYPQNEPLSYAEFFPLAIEGMKSVAREVNSYVVFNIYEPIDDEKRYISNIMINKNGEIAGKYRKMYPTEGEMASGVVPGVEHTVVDTEFGKIGIATCFDIGFRDFWKKLADMGAQAVIWTSAYDGGNLLDAYAVVHGYWVISSVRTFRSRVIDPAGRTVAESARWDNVCLCDVDLDMELFHIDDQIPKISEIRRDFGEAVLVQTLSEDNIFTVASLDPSVFVKEIKNAKGLISYREYHEKALGIREDILEKMK